MSIGEEWKNQSRETPVHGSKRSAPIDQDRWIEGALALLEHQMLQCSLGRFQENHPLSIHILVFDAEFPPEVTSSSLSAAIFTHFAKSQRLQVGTTAG